MSTESQQQIADETASQHYGAIKDDEMRALAQRNLSKDILSAIERATELTAVERAENNRNKAVVEAIATAQPQRSEQQEWTVKEQDDTFAIFEGGKQICDWCFSAAMLQNICDAHNAALTAERQRRKQESERHIAKNKQVAEQLLSALGAIEKLHGLAESAIYALKGKLPNPDICNRDLIAEALINDLTKQIDAAKITLPDLSLLHEHDAEQFQKGWHKGFEACAEANGGNKERLVSEVRKPLVDALEELLDTSKDVRTGVFPTEAHLNARKKSVQLLAKVKQ